MKMADSLLAFVLLDNAGISDEGKKLAFTALNATGISFKNMKSALVRVFSTDNTTGLDAYSERNIEIKQEAMYTLGRKSYYKNDYKKYNNNSFSNKSSSKIKYNPKNKYGQITHCKYCDSTLHWGDQCPDKHRFSHLEGINLNEGYSDDSDNEEGPEESVNIILMAEDVSSQNVLLAETDSSALLDTACSKTVGGSLG